MSAELQSAVFEISQLLRSPDAVLSGKWQAKPEPQNSPFGRQNTGLLR
jgi:hypothetical protein